MGHFDVNKTFKILKEHFYCPHLEKHVLNFCEKFYICKTTNLQCYPMACIYLLKETVLAEIQEGG